ncbi:CAP domain-containing protein [Thalassovita sp.]|uniref:CAP domain-containing protein n=1 Tax=Thalassovita sp. TaxID=1979401 RepID=UPI0029DE700A|nr:CAP domain-containing protein [Thalassovita sp.]
MSIANELEQYMLDLINAERAANGLAALKLEQHLNDSSEDHSAWMVDNAVFSHTGAGGSTSYQRMVAAGFDFSGSWRSGENIGYQSIRGEAGYFDDVEDIHDRLMDSTGHRWNLLNPDYEYVGLGIEIGVINGLTIVMVTQNFADTSGSVLLDPYGDGSGSSGGGAELPLVLTGDGGHNVLTGGALDDVIRGKSGRDTLTGLDGQDTLKGGGWSDALDGGADNDKLFGGSGYDTISGGSGNDKLVGGRGKDVMSGGSGNDTLSGGEHSDILTGGAGNDTFVFTDADHSRTTAHRDVITDFDTVTDRIKLSGVDANDLASGDQAFDFIGTAAFSGTAGELRYQAVNSGADREIQGDTDGDGVADFLILLNGQVTLSAGDFLL